MIVTGKVRADKRAPGGFELDVSDAQVVQRVNPDDPYPITPKEHGVDFLMEHRHLWLRSPRQAAILRVRAEIIRAARDFFDDRGFTLTDPPILTPAACEGTTTLFPVDYFDEQAYPDAVRPALHRSDGDGVGQGLQLRADLPRGEIEDAPPSHRVLDGRAGGRLRHARRPDGAGRGLRHLHRASAAGDAAARSWRPSGATSRSWRRSTTPFPRISYDEAVKMLQEGHAKGELENKFEWGGDFGSPDETYISSQFDRPVMVHRYPAAVKAFYMEPDPERPELALCVDVLAPEGYGEIIGGSQRMAIVRAAAAAH